MSTSIPGEDSNPAGPIGESGLSLRALLQDAVFVGAEDIQAVSCANRADRCRPGDVFVPDSTCSIDQHDLAAEAVQRGAVAIVCERILPVSVPQCLVEDTAEVYGQICQGLVGNPSARMLTIAVVGTHAKTTTALHVAAMLKRLGGAVAYYTSLGASDSTECDRSATRPPTARKLAHWLQKADLAGSPAAIIEMSPAMLRSQVASGVEFDLVILTGMRSAQIRGSASSRQYRYQLQRLLTCTKTHGNLLYNADDACAAQWVQKNFPAAVSYGIDAAEHVRAKRLTRFGGEQQLLAIAENRIMPLTLRTPGDHVARAALAAIATAWMFDFSIPQAVAGVEALDGVPGRMQRISQAVEVPVYVDAGNTPDRIAVALHGLRSHQMGKATVVVELEPRLDSRWRQRLGELLEKTCEQVILCSSELSPEATQSLAMDVLGGCTAPGRVQVIADREAAIHYAVMNTPEGCVLLSGRGAGVWTSREGDAVTDESIAVQAVSQKNEAAALPNLSIFPASEPPAFFSH